MLIVRSTGFVSPNTGSHHGAVDHFVACCWSVFTHAMRRCCVGDDGAVGVQLGWWPGQCWCEKEASKASYEPRHQLCAPTGEWLAPSGTCSCLPLNSFGRDARDVCRWLLCSLFYLTLVQSDSHFHSAVCCCTCVALFTGLSLSLPPLNMVTSLIPLAMYQCSIARVAHNQVIKNDCFSA